MRLVYVRTCVRILRVYCLSSIYANILTENLQTLKKFMNHPRLSKASLINFVLFI